MLLVIDIGNTNMTLGVFDGEILKTTFLNCIQIEFKRCSNKILVLS